MKIDKTMIFRYDNSTGDELDYLSETLGRTKSEVVRHCVDKVYTLLYLYNHFGLTDNEIYATAPPITIASPCDRHRSSTRM